MQAWTQTRKRKKVYGIGREKEKKGTVKFRCCSNFYFIFEVQETTTNQQKHERENTIKLCVYQNYVDQ